MSSRTRISIALAGTAAICAARSTARIDVLGKLGE